MNIVEHNDYKFEAVSVFLRPEEHIMIYSYTVNRMLSCLCLGIVFKPECLWISTDYLPEICEVFKDLGVIPNFKRNPEFYKISNFLES